MRQYGQMCSDQMIGVFDILSSVAVLDFVAIFAANQVEMAWSPYLRGSAWNYHLKGAKNCLHVAKDIA